MTLNLPFGTPLAGSQSSSPCPSVSSNTSQTSVTSTATERGVFVELTNDYRMQHFMAGLVLSDLAIALDRKLVYDVTS